MRATGISELKARLSQFLDYVRAGDEVLVTDRGVPVARIVPAGGGDTGPDLAALARAGLVRLPEKPPTARPKPVGADRRGRSLEILREDRTR